MAPAILLFPDLQPGIPYCLMLEIFKASLQIDFSLCHDLLVLHNSYLSVKSEYQMSLLDLLPYISKIVPVVANQSIHHSIHYM